MHLPVTEASSSLTLPAVFSAPIRIDVVQQVHSALFRTLLNFLFDVL